MTDMKTTTKKSRAVGVIGGGVRVSFIGQAMQQVDPAMRIVAIADPDEAESRKCMALRGVPLDGVRYYSDADRLLADADGLDGILIGTRCDLHVTMALKVARTGLPLYLEKPVAITRPQLVQLAEAFRGREDRVVVSFPLRLTAACVKVAELIRAGRLGPVVSIQAVNNVPYGGVYFGSWYRNYAQTGGLWLQKATHDFDYINSLMPSAPVRLAAVSTINKVYGGDKPYDLHCAICGEQATCPESTLAQQGRGDAGGMDWCELEPGDHWCAFSRGIQNQEAGSAIIAYADGSHASYSQNFVARREAGYRGATVIGYRATATFDFGGRVRIVDHHEKKVEELTADAVGGHGGGDEALIRAFGTVMRGEGPSMAPLTAGLLSAAMSLAARESAATNTFQDIHQGDCCEQQ